MSNVEHTDHPEPGELEALRTGEAEVGTAEHVAGCAECQAMVDDLGELAQLVRDATLPLPPLPDAIDQRIRWNNRKQAARIRRELRWAQRQRPPLPSAEATADKSPRLPTRPRLHRTSRRTSWALAASVVLTLAGLAAWRQMQSGGPAAVPSGVIAARALARQLQAAEATQIGDPRWDVNGDGRVDSADLDAMVDELVGVEEA